MKKVIFSTLLCGLFYILTTGLALSAGYPFDIRSESPTGANWTKITNIHYLNKSSVTKIKGEVYQVELCNVYGDKWFYFNVRLSCSSRKSWQQSEDEWMGPFDPSYFEKAALDEICK